MTLAEQIQLHVQQLPSEKQGEVLDFILFLQQRVPEQVGEPLKGTQRQFGSAQGMIEMADDFDTKALF